MPHIRIMDIPCDIYLREHPFKTSPFLRGEGSKIDQICRRIHSTKKLPTEGGRGQKSLKICRRLKWMVPYLMFTHLFLLENKVFLLDDIVKLNT